MGQANAHLQLQITALCVHVDLMGPVHRQDIRACEGNNRHGIERRAVLDAVWCISGASTVYVADKLCRSQTG
jgi:hypothetical protein